MERETLTVEEAAQVLGIGRSCAYEAARQGQIPVVRVGRRFVVPRAALEEFLQGKDLEGSTDRTPQPGTGKLR